MLVTNAHVATPSVMVPQFFRLIHRGHPISGLRAARESFHDSIISPNMNSKDSFSDSKHNGGRKYRKKVIFEFMLLAFHHLNTSSSHSNHWIFFVVSAILQYVEYLYIVYYTTEGSKNKTESHPRSLCIQDIWSILVDWRYKHEDIKYTLSKWFGLLFIRRK